MIVSPARYWSRASVSALPIKFSLSWNKGRYTCGSARSVGIKPTPKVLLGGLQKHTSTAAGLTRCMISCKSGDRVIAWVHRLVSMESWNGSMRHWVHEMSISGSIKCTFNASSTSDGVQRLLFPTRGCQVSTLGHIHCGP